MQQKQYKALGVILAAARNRAGLTQQELAKLLKKPQSFVSAFEQGQRRVDLLEFLRIMDALDADPIMTFAEIHARARR